MVIHNMTWYKKEILWKQIIVDVRRPQLINDTNSRKHSKGHAHLN